MNSIKCPSLDLSKDERIKELFNKIEMYLMSEPIQVLLELFGAPFSLKEIKTLKDRIETINSFSEVWDYRKGERWTIKDDPFIKNNEAAIMECIDELGFVKTEFPLEAPHYILPLGGARMSNNTRCKLAKKVVDLYPEERLRVVALSGERLINQEVEGPYLKEYAPNAKTEFEAMCGGIEKNFGTTEFKENRHSNENINLQWVEREYEEVDNVEIFSLAAPSSNPDRRANSLDTFNFFISKFDIKPQERLLLVTSAHYETFQFLKFVDIAIEKQFYVETVGVENVNNAKDLYLVSNYLQEVKATINAMKALADKYL